MGFHAKGDGWGKSAELNRTEKEALVRAGRAQAALVYDIVGCVGWCQFGRAPELPRIKNKRAYEAGRATLPDRTALPDWRITCFFVDKAHRGTGVARAALGCAIREIALLGGGTVEAYPEDIEGGSVPGTFLHSGTVPMFLREGFACIRPIGKRRWVVSKYVEGSS